MHGTLPSSVEKDLPHFVMFFVAPIQFNFDEKSGEPILLTKDLFRCSVWKTVKAMFFLAAALGVVVHYQYEVFERKEVHSFWDLLYWRNVMNNYAMACKFFLSGSITTYHIGVLLRSRANLQIWSHLPKKCLMKIPQLRYAQGLMQVLAW